MTLRPINECIYELLGGAPVNLDIKKLRKKLKSIDGVIKMYDLHVWSLAEGRGSLTCHLTTTEDNFNDILCEATKICHDVDIYHVTI